MATDGQWHLMWSRGMTRTLRTSSHDRVVGNQHFWWPPVETLQLRSGLGWDGARPPLFNMTGIVSHPPARTHDGRSSMVGIKSRCKRGTCVLPDWLTVHAGVLLRSG